MVKKRVVKRYRRKGRWSANIKQFGNVSINATDAEFIGQSILCQNPIQTDTSVSQQYTVKNVEVSFQIENDPQSPSTHTAIESITLFIMYVPQGMNIDSNYPNYHPEYIMAMRFLGSPDLETNGPMRNPLRIKTRLARRLQTGDSIVLFIKGYGMGIPQEINLRFHGIVRWWTKAN